MDEDAVLSKITRLLEQGCTMLATHHDCGAPLFRCKGEIVCPVCSFPDSLADADQTASPAPAAPLPYCSQPLLSLQTDPAVAEKSGRAGEEQWPALAAQLRGSLLRRLQGLAEAIEGEQDLDRLRRELECVEGLLRALRALQE